MNTEITKKTIEDLVENLDKVRNILKDVMDDDLKSAYPNYSDNDIDWLIYETRLALTNGKFNINGLKDSSEVEILENDLEEAESNLSEAEDKIYGLEEDNEDLKNENEDLKSENDSLKDKVQNLENENADLRSRIDELENERDVSEAY